MSVGYADFCKLMEKSEDLYRVGVLFGECKDCITKAIINIITQLPP